MIVPVNAGLSSTDCEDLSALLCSPGSTAQRRLPASRLGSEIEGDAGLLSVRRA